MAAQTVEVEKRIGAPLPTLLQVARLGHPLGDRSAGVAAGLVVQRGGFARHGQVQVNAVQQRPRQLVAITLDLVGAAAAAAARVAEVAARVRVTW